MCVGVRPRALPRCRLRARFGGTPRARSGAAWRTVLWVVSHVRGRPWVVSGGVLKCEGASATTAPKCTKVHRSAGCIESRKRSACIRGMWPVCRSACHRRVCRSRAAASTGLGGACARAHDNTASCPPQPDRAARNSRVSVTAHRTERRVRPAMEASRCRSQGQGSGGNCGM